MYSDPRSWRKSGRLDIEKTFLYMHIYGDAPLYVWMRRCLGHEILKLWAIRSAHWLPQEMEAVFSFCLRFGGGERIWGERSKWPKTPPFSTARRRRRPKNIIFQKSMIIRNFPEIWRFCPIFLGGGGENIFANIYFLGGGCQHWICLSVCLGTLGGSNQTSCISFRTSV